MYESHHQISDLLIRLNCSCLMINLIVSVCVSQSLAGTHLTLKWSQLETTIINIDRFYDYATPLGAPNLKT